jgi:hypothetical protein
MEVCRCHCPSGGGGSGGGKRRINGKSEEALVALFAGPWSQLLLIAKESKESCQAS